MTTIIITDGSAALADGSAAEPGTFTVIGPTGSAVKIRIGADASVKVVDGDLINGPHEIAGEAADAVPNLPFGPPAVPTAQATPASAVGTPPDSAPTSDPGAGTPSPAAADPTTPPPGGTGDASAAGDGSSGAKDAGK